MNELQVFQNPAFGDIRVMTVDGEPWIVGKDVAAALGYTNPRKALIDHVDAEDKNTVTIRDGIPGNPNMTVINESGLYSLVLSSKLPDAKKFRRWVTSEVLPSIRKNGGYIAGQENLTDAELMAKAILVANRTIEERNTRIRALTEKIELDAPKVLFADSVSASKDSILIGELAKILADNGVPNMGQNRLFQWMRDNGYLIRRAGTDYNAPTQSAMERGLFTLKETAITHSDGHISTRITTRVSGKGQQYFVNLFLKAHNLPSADEREAEKAYKDALEYFYQAAPGMAVCEREHAGKKYLCIPAEAARKTLEDRGVEPRQFMGRVKQEGRLRVGKRGCAIATRDGENIQKCYWLTVTPEAAAT